MPDNSVSSEPAFSPIADAVRSSIRDAFAAVPKGKRGALLVIADSNGARATVAANLNGSWKVAAAASRPWSGPVTATVAIIGVW